MTYSDVVVWNNVLSPEQIDQMYISGSNGFDYNFPLTGAYWQGQELPAPWTSSSVGMLSYDWGIGAQSVTIIPISLRSLMQQVQISRFKKAQQPPITLRAR